MFSGPGYVPPVHPPVNLGPTHATGPRDQRQKRDQQKRKKPGEPDHDEVELSGATPSEQPSDAPHSVNNAGPALPTVVHTPPLAPPRAAQPPHGQAAPPPQRHIDLNG